MFGRRLLCCCLAIYTLIPSAFGQIHSNAYNVIDQMARQRNESGIKQFKQQYGTIDYTDSYGQTPLCTAIRRNDYMGYLMLARNGANRQHNCIQQMSASQKAAFNQQFKSFMSSLTYRSDTISANNSSISPVWWGIGGAAGLGVAVAAIAGGGGGGSSSDSSAVNPNPTVSPKPTVSPTPTITPKPTIAPTTPTKPTTPTVTPTKPTAPSVTPTKPTSPTVAPTTPTNPTTPTTPTPVPLSPVQFQTSEYYNGNFLNTVKAAEAYARLYTGTKDSSGQTVIQHDLENVVVAVVDSGVYQNNDLKNKLLTGVNYDYGPCGSSRTTNCWKYSSSAQDITLVNKYGQETSISYGMTPTQYATWLKKYESDYTWNPYDTTPNPNASDGPHGTHVTGIIAAEKNNSYMHGVAPNASIFPIKYDFMSGLTNPITTALSAGAKVINASLGTAASSNYDAAVALNNRTRYNNLMSYNMAGFKKLADEQSAVLVVAAGNEGHTQPSIESGAGLYYPDLADVMIVVVNINPSTLNLGTRSNQCGAAAGYCLAAPGESVYSTYGDGNSYGTLTGTSMATPVVSGAVALLMGAYPDLTPAEVTEILFETATPLDGQELSSKFGHGLLNLDAATTQPVGQPMLATTSSITGERIALSETRLAVPRVMSKMLAQMPATVSILDKYDRSFEIATSALVHTNERDSRIFQNQLHRFMKFDSVHQFHDENSPMSFSFSTATKKDSTLGVGAMDVTYQFDSNKTRFYFTEDSQYGNGEFFDKVTLNPFSAIENAYGFENTYALNKSIDVNFGFATGRNALFKTNEDDSENARRLTSFQGGIAYKPFKNLSLQMIGGALNEEESLLGLRGTGAFDVETSRTYYMGLNATVKALKNLTLTGSYYYGMTPAQKLNAYTHTSRLYSESIALDARWHLNPTDYFGVFLSSPLRIKRGVLKYKLPSGRDYYSDRVYFNEGRASLAGTKREWDTGIYGAYTLTPDIRMKAQTGIRFNPEHQADAKPDYQVLFGIDWKWN